MTLQEAIRINLGSAVILGDKQYAIGELLTKTFYNMGEVFGTWEIIS